MFTTTLKERVASKSLVQILEAINAQVDEIELCNLSLPTQLQEDLDHATDLLTQSIQEAANKAIPRTRRCERSKPWWSKELAEQRKQASRAIRMQQEFLPPQTQEKQRLREINTCMQSKQQRLVTGTASCRRQRARISLKLLAIQSKEILGLFLS